VQGDITAEHVDVIVNAANPMLQHGGGVAAAISKAAGPALQLDSDEWIRAHGAISHHLPAWTPGGSLAARYVVHALGPVYGEGDEDRKLQVAVRSALRVAEDLGAASISMPAISTGIFGFPRERAAILILNAIDSYMTANTASGLNRIRLVVFDEPSVQAFRTAFASRT
jgi:O-acetyl-ADP-ribose deacetylase (regulator of RNase III)